MTCFPRRWRPLALARPGAAVTAPAGGQDRAAQSSALHGVEGCSSSGLTMRKTPLRRAARDPSSPPGRLLRLARWHPRDVLANPVFQRVLSEEPELILSTSDEALWALLRQRELPARLLEVLSRSQNQQILAGVLSHPATPRACSIRSPAALIFACAAAPCSTRRSRRGCATRWWPGRAPMSRASNHFLAAWSLVRIQTARPSQTRSRSTGQRSSWASLLWPGWPTARCAPG